MPLKSILEEYQLGKSKLLSKLVESEDQVVKEANEKLKAGRKWKVDNAVEDAKGVWNWKKSSATPNHREGVWASRKRNGGLALKAKQKEIWLSKSKKMKKTLSGSRKLFSKVDKANGQIGKMPLKEA